ncbi:MAG: thermonuclease family protein [Planctomycetota bacterium]|jgi:micrococcal nuclease
MSRKSGRRLAAGVLFGVLVAVALGILGRTTSPRPAPGRGALEGTVSEVYDGDTVEVRGLGPVRLIGIDAMDQMNEERTLSQSQRYGMRVDRVRHWAGRASAFAHEGLDGQQVALHFGDEEADGYGRTLAYVHPLQEEGGEGEDFNLLMLREGLAAAYHAFPHPRRSEYLRAEDGAQAERRGLWQDASIHP